MDKKNLTPEMLVMLDMSRAKFIDVNKEYLKTLNIEYYDLTDKDGKVQPLNCPLHLWAVYNGLIRARGQVGSTASCLLCGNPMCPECGNHLVEQLSRVTGYMGNVSGWNAAKQQEYKDRMRYQVGGRNI